MLVHRDCIFYKYTGTPEWKEIELGRGNPFLPLNANCMRPM